MGHTMRALVSPCTLREPSPRLPSPPHSHEGRPAGRAPRSLQHRAWEGGVGTEQGCARRGGEGCCSSSTVPLKFCCSRAGMRCRRFRAKLSKLCGPAKQMRALRRRPCARTGTNVWLSCKRVLMLFCPLTPPPPDSMPLFQSCNKKSLLSHPGSTSGAEHRKRRVTDRDHAAIDVQRSEQRPTQGSAQTICPCVLLPDTPCPPRQLPSFPSTLALHGVSSLHF